MTTFKKLASNHHFVKQVVVVPYIFDTAIVAVVHYQKKKNVFRTTVHVKYVINPKTSTMVCEGGERYLIQNISGIGTEFEKKSRLRSFALIGLQ